MIEGGGDEDGEIKVRRKTIAPESVDLSESRDGDGKTVAQ